MLLCLASVLFPFRVDCLHQPDPTMRCVVPKCFIPLCSFDCPGDMDHVSESNTKIKKNWQLKALTRKKHLFSMGFDQPKKANLRTSQRSQLTWA